MGILLNNFRTWALCYLFWTKGTNAHFGRVSLVNRTKFLPIKKRSICFIKKKKGVMLTSALRVLVKNLIKENFYGKRKKINIFTTFFISHKSNVKTFLK